MTRSRPRKGARGVEPPRSAPQTSIEPRPSGERIALIAVALVIVFVALVRLRVASVPLERDEGEYAYAGRLILEGIPPYRLAYNMKFPGTYYAYAVILAVFGKTPWGIHVGLLVVNAATILLVYGIGRRFLGPFAGAIAATSFALLSLDRSILGVFAHATHFVLLPALGGLYLLLRERRPVRLRDDLAAGALLGVAVLMKQHAIFFLAIGAGLLLAQQLGTGERDLRAAGKRLGLLAAGSAAPFALLVVVFLAQGVLGRFWFWTFRYAKEYVSQVPLSQAGAILLDTLGEMTGPTLLLWLLAGGGLLGLWLVPWPRATRAFLTALLAGSFLATCPGFYFRQHYFILVLPALALLAAVAIASGERLLARALPARAARVIALLVFAAAAGNYVAKEREFLFSMTPRDLSRLRYGGNPFIEAAEIAKYIDAHTDPTDRIAVLGSEPEIYFYADRHSATGYVYTYPLMEPQPFAHTMQQEMIREIEAVHPKYLVFVQIGASWLPRPGSDQTIIQWGNRYTRECFDLVGVADIHSKDVTTYVWEERAAEYKPISQALVYTFRRKSEEPCVASR